MPKFLGTPTKRIIIEEDVEYFKSIAIGDTHTSGGTLLSKKEPTAELELCDSESTKNCNQCIEASNCPFYNQRLRI